MKIGAIFESDDWYRITLLTTDWIFEHGDAWFWHVFIIDLGNKGKRGGKRFGVLGAKIRQILSSKIFNVSTVEVINDFTGFTKLVLYCQCYHIFSNNSGFLEIVQILEPKNIFTSNF